MSALILRNHSHNNITIVENDFIDHYMVSANGEYVKVYLLLLRYQNIPEQLPDIQQMADLLENTEGDQILGKRRNSFSRIWRNKWTRRNLYRKSTNSSDTCQSGFPYTFRTVCFRSWKISGRAVWWKYHCFRQNCRSESSCIKTFPCCKKRIKADSFYCWTISWQNLIPYRCWCDYLLLWFPWFFRRPDRVSDRILCGERT